MATGIVLSGGGARGAYEAGVVAGIVEVLARKPRAEAPFSIFTGTSVGAINAA
ncbi:MAG: patatin-like phospholipase family protein, partial [Myxococcales bacterium]|nr:patatin-like phospholipase family protein [Myxococcales bacterium]